MGCSYPHRGRCDRCKKNQAIREKQVRTGRDTTSYMSANGYPLLWRSVWRGKTNGEP